MCHDTNANEVCEAGEPLVSGVDITPDQVGRSSEPLRCSTGDQGTCLTQAPVGRHNLRANASGGAVLGLDYLFADKEVFDARGEGITIDVQGDAAVIVALGQGPLPFPIAGNSFGGVIAGFGEYRYDGDREVYYYHDGVDPAVVGNGPQPIYANISGVVESVGGECNGVTILRRARGQQFNVGMGHLTSIIVKPGDRVTKGDIIGFINPDLYDGSNVIACTTIPHIHYNVWGNAPGQTWEVVDGTWQTLSAGQWGWLDPTELAPLRRSPRPMFHTFEEAEQYRSR